MLPHCSLVLPLTATSYSLAVHTRRCVCATLNERRAMQLVMDGQHLSLLQLKSSHLDSSCLQQCEYRLRLFLTASHNKNLVEHILSVHQGVTKVSGNRAVRSPG